MKKSITTIFLSFILLGLSAQTLSLDSCKRLSISNNKKVKEAVLKVAESKQIKKYAFTKYFPQVNAGFTAMKAQDYFLKTEIPEMNLPVYDGNPINLLNPTQFAYFPGMELNLLDYANMGFIAAVEPIYAGGQLRHGNQLAALGIKINEHGVKLSQEETLLKTAEQYWVIVSLYEKKKTLASYQKLLANLFDDVSVAFNAGLIQRSDLLKVELKQNELEGQKLRLENGIKLASMALCQHIGQPYTTTIRFEEKIEIEPSLGSNAKTENIVQNRQEYQMLSKAVKAEKLQKKNAIGENMPQLAVGLSGLYMDVLENESANAIAFATLNIPISGWWGGSHKIKEHQIKVEIAENKLKETAELLGLQIEKTNADLNESFKQISIAEKSVEQGKEHLKMVHDNFKAGIVGTSDLLEAQAMYQEVMDNLTDAQCHYLIKLAQNRHALAQSNAPKNY
jgi:outer membrane protein TolC